MAVLEVIRMGHPTLRKQAAPWPKEKITTDEFRQLVVDLRETMHAYGGIGLAAPQVNLPWQIAVIEVGDEPSRYGNIEPLPFAVYVNPEITVLDDATAGYWEGCLSVPGMMGYVERPQHIRVDYLDDTGEQRSLEARGFLATVFQHEFDHLQGKLYIDRLKDTTRLAFEEEYRQFHMGE
ncbi:MAG: peptide deformylase [Pseudomonadales bacterium]|nr:peptide deformylase [Pseudomonadales bacterium]